MSDSACHVKIEFTTHGRTFRYNADINWTPEDGVDERVRRFFEESVAAAEPAAVRVVEDVAAVAREAYLSKYPEALRPLAAEVMDEAIRIVVMGGCRHERIGAGGCPDCGWRPVAMGSAK